MLPAQPNQSLIDGLACLQALASSSEAVGNRELARTLGLEPTRVNRLLKTLAHLGLAEQDAQRRYRPGPAIHVLAAQSLFGSKLIRRAIGPLEELHRFGLIVALGVLWRDQTSYLYHAEPGMTAAHALGRVGLHPATATGIGMALLARQPDESISDQYGPSDELSGALARIRTQNYALVTTDRRHRTVAVVIEGGDAALGLSGEFPDARVPELVAALRDAAAEIGAPGEGNE
jgi:DNA-binding IclR family transcriptional regulator